MLIRVSRKGTIWYDDYYEIPELTEENVRRCIEDDSEFFTDSECEHETWAATGEIEVVDCETYNSLIDNETCEIKIPRDD